MPRLVSAVAALTLLAAFIARSSHAQFAEANSQPDSRLEFHRDWNQALAYTPDGKRLAVGSHDQQISLWDPAEAKRLEKVHGHQAPVTAVTFSDDGKLLISASQDGAIVVWNVEPWRKVHELKGHQGAVDCLAVSGDHLFSGGQDGVRWSLKTGKQQLLLKDSAQSGRVLALSVPRQATWKFSGIVAGASTGKLLVWLEMDEPPQVVSAHASSVVDLSASSDGSWVAACASDGSASLWDGLRFRKVRTFSATEAITAVALSADGRFLATAHGNRKEPAESDPGHIKLREALSGKILGQVEGSRRAIVRVRFSPDQKQLAAVGGESAALLWKSPVAPDRALSDQATIDSLTKKIKAAIAANELAALHEQRGYEYVKLERWAKATADYLQAAKFVPSNNMHLLRAGIVAQMANVRQAQVLAAKGLTKLLSADSLNMYLAERVLKVCAISSPPMGDHKHLATLAAQSVERSPNLAWNAYFPSTAALLFYRLKDYDKAMVMVTESRRRNTNPRYRPHLPELANRGIETLCLTQQGELDQAERVLSRLESMMDTHRGTPTSAGKNMFHDWLTAELLYLEARARLHEARHKQQQDQPAAKKPQPEAP